MLFRFRVVVGLLVCGVCLVGSGSVVFAASDGARSDQSRECPEGQYYFEGKCYNTPPGNDSVSSYNGHSGSTSSGGRGTAPVGSSYGVNPTGGGAGESETADNTDGDGEPCEEQASTTETQQAAAGAGGWVIVEIVKSLKNGGTYRSLGGQVTLGEYIGQKASAVVEAGATKPGATVTFEGKAANVITGLTEKGAEASVTSLTVRTAAGELIKVVIRTGSVVVGAVLIAGQSSDANAGESDADLYQYRNQSWLDSLSDDDSACTEAEANGEDRVSTGSTSSSTSTSGSSSTSSSPVGDSRSGGTTRQTR